MKRRLACMLAVAMAAAVGGCAAVPPTQAFDLQAHRGGRELAPENTLDAFAKAVALGVDTLELDIQLTADGVVVISHDTALNPDHTRDAQGRWLSGTGPTIGSLTLAELQRYDVGRLQPESSYGRQFARQVPRDGERIPTLAALFDQVHTSGATGVRFNIETKLDPTRPGETAAPEPMVRALLGVIDRAQMGARVTVQSFDWRTLTLVGQLAPQLPRAYLTSPRTLRDIRWTAGLDAAGFSSVPSLVKAAAGNGTATVTWSPSFADVTPGQVREAQALGLKVIPWTVNRRADMARLLDWQVDGLITDEPDVLRNVMQERGMRVPRGGGH